MSTKMIPLALFCSLKGCAGVCIEFSSYLIPDLGHPGPASDKAETKESPVCG